MRDLGRWTSSDSGFFSATDVLPWGGKRHMVVEVLPDGGWDWSAWVTGGEGRVMHGREDTLICAVAAVQSAAQKLDDGIMQAVACRGLQTSARCAM